MNNSDTKSLSPPLMGNSNANQSVVQSHPPARPWAADRLILLPGVVACRPRTGASSMSLHVLIKGALQESSPGLLFSTFEVAPADHELRELEGSEDQ